MKRVRFRDPAGAVRAGEWLDEDGSPAGTDTAGTGGVVRAGGREYAPAEVSVLAPCEPSKLVCVGRNYAAHADEMGGDVPDRPLLFLKPPNTVATHGSEVRLPAGKERIDHEAELGVVIGEQCRNVDVEAAMDVVAGYTCVVDLSNRDDQRAEQNWVRERRSTVPRRSVRSSPRPATSPRTRAWNCGSTATADSRPRASNSSSRCRSSSRR
jgi:2-keto-4-pentenoate hydratase/2-oxohepta-3-ene-1,7-dioic acid hydratase (catechol pathway)